MLCSIVGLMSSGKTMYLVYRLFLAYLNGKTIYTNIHLNFPHIKVTPEWVESMVKKKNWNIPINSVAIGFDEIWLWLMDSRKSQKNSMGTYFFLQSSKDDLEIYFTAQDNRQNDVRLRQNLHKIVKCSRVLNIDGKLTPISDEKRYLPPNLTKDLYICATTNKRVSTGITTGLVHQKTEYIRAFPIIPLYRTAEKVKTGYVE